MNDKIFITVQKFLDSKKKNTRLSYAKALQLYAEHLGMTDKNELTDYVKTLTAQKYNDDLEGFVTALKNKRNTGNNPDEPLNKKTIMARTMGIRAYVTMNGMTARIGLVTQLNARRRQGQWSARGILELPPGAERRSGAAVRLHCLVRFYSLNFLRIHSGSRRRSITAHTMAQSSSIV